MLSFIEIIEVWGILIHNALQNCFVVVCLQWKSIFILFYLFIIIIITIFFWGEGVTERPATQTLSQRDPSLGPDP